MMTQMPPMPPQPAPQQQQPQGNPGFQQIYQNNPDMLQRLIGLLPQQTAVRHPLALFFNQHQGQQFPPPQSMPPTQQPPMGTMPPSFAPPQTPQMPTYQQHWQMFMQDPLFQHMLELLRMRQNAHPVY